MLGGYIFLGQMVSVGNYRRMVSSRDEIFYVGPSTHTWGYGKFVNARHAWNQAATFHPRYGKFNSRNFNFDGKNRFEYFMATKTC